MQHLINKYLGKLESQGLAATENAVFLCLDAEFYSNKPIKDDVLKLRKVFDLMNINTILFSEPAEPYKSIIDGILRYDSLCSNQSKIIPMDCETRTFFHDIPVIDDYSPEQIAGALSRRKSVIVKNKGIVTYGTLTPEQAFVSFSSTCFSTYVKFFFDSLIYFEKKQEEMTAPDDAYISEFNKIVWLLKTTAGNKQLSGLMKDVPCSGDDIVRMLSEAGRAVVEHRLVDSYFGNISFVFNNNIYISETGSSMDELECCIDAVPLDGSSSVGITASSELSAHLRIHEETGHNAILHGHPKFSVIMSMLCDKKDCRYYLSRELCHKACKEKRYISGAPVVSGEIGTGSTGLMNTVPPAMKEGKGAIVYGHGVFTSGLNDFNEPFDMLMDIEKRCTDEYFRRINKYLNP